MIEDLSYSDFNDLYVIALGLSMAYIVVRGKKDYGFYRVLSEITSSLNSKISSSVSTYLYKVGILISKYEYFLEKKNLSESAKKDLTKIRNDAKTLEPRIRAYKFWFMRKLRFHTRTNFLYVISYDCFLLALLIECFIPFVKINQDKVDQLLSWELIVILVLLIHCLVCEHIEYKGLGKIFKPSLFNHSLIIVVFGLMVFLWSNFPEALISDSKYIAIGLVVGCFSGFLAYLLIICLINIAIFIKSSIIFLVFCFKIYYWSIIIKFKHNKELTEMDKKYRNSPEVIVRQENEENTES